MKLGAMWFHTERGPEITELAPHLEGLGYESLWLAEHSHIPVGSEPQWPGGTDLPAEYYETFDPFVSLAAAAVATRTLRLGTGVALVVQRDPIQLAKQVASLDQISGGRVELGIGGGWNTSEMADHGTDPDTRFRLMRERVEAMKAIWAGDTPEYHGRLVDFGPMVARPLPVQRPHPRIHIGGAAPGALRRVAAYGDGWVPMAMRESQDLGDSIADLHRRLAAAGREPSEVEVSIFFGRTSADALARYRELGVARLVVLLPAGDRDATLRVAESRAGVLAGA
jgi:probable F420-dependent oxidoreductase